MGFLKFYTWTGAASLIGCNIIHTRPRNAPAKGRIEKLLRLCHERLEHEMAASGKTATLKEYNLYLDAYVAQDYHRQVHSVTKQTPEECFFPSRPTLSCIPGMTRL